MKDKTKQTNGENEIVEILNAKGDIGEIKEIMKKYESTREQRQRNNQD